MEKYTYSPLSLEELPKYIESRHALRDVIDYRDIVFTEEIGDGNLNYVYRARDGQGRSIILKQAPPYVRMTGEGWPMTPERSRFEVNSLRIHGELVPDLVVKVLDVDYDRFIFAMEDLSDHRVWRASLIDGEYYPGVADKVGEYVGALAVETSVIGAGREQYADTLAQFINTELSTITDDLVFTEPIADIGRNSTLPANEDDAHKFAQNLRSKLMNGLAKWKFMTGAEALIHGDLHTGSIMIRANKEGTAVDSVKVFDSEFACMGPVGYDLGAALANYVIAAARAIALGEDARAEKIMHMCEETLESFNSHVRARVAAKPEDPLWDKAFIDERIRAWDYDAWMFAACKMSRRVVGAAKTKDLTTLPDNLREGADRGVLHCAMQIAQWITDGRVPGDGIGSEAGGELLQILQKYKTV